MDRPLDLAALPDFQPALNYLAPDSASAYLKRVLVISRATFLPAL